MTELEKLFIQLFERKDWIIEHVQQQADSYTQLLASRLLSDGITPPPWLLRPNFNSYSSNPNEFEKEEIISKCLYRPPRDSNRYSTGGHSLYHRPIVTGGNIANRVSTEMYKETLAPNKDFNLSNEPVLTHECKNNDTVGSLDQVPELDDSARSPQNETDAIITSIYAATDTSLARIQRSKSRQKARELRTSGKTTAKSCSSNENRTCISFSGDARSKKDIHQVIQGKCPSDMSKRNHIGGATSVAEEGNGEKGNDGTRDSYTLAKSFGSCDVPSFANEHTKIGSCRKKGELDGGIMVKPTCDSLQQSCHVNGVISGKTQGTQSQKSVFCGRITRSRSSRQQTSGINKLSQLHKPVSCNLKGGGAPSNSAGDLMYELNTSNKLSDAVETSQVLCDINAETQAICSNEGVLKLVIENDMVASSLVANHQENAEIVVGNGPIDEPVPMQPVNSVAELDPVTVCMESEGLAIRKSSHCCVNVKPKQLNFDENDECEVNEIFSSLSKKRKLDGLDNECYPSKESSSSKDHKSRSIEQELPKANVVSNSPKNGSARSYNNIDESAKDESKYLASDMYENPMVEDVEHGSKFSGHVDVTCEVDLPPKEVDNESEEELHSEKSPLNEDRAFSLKMQTNEDDFGKKDKESAAGIYIPVSNKNTSFTSSLTKLRNNGFEDCLDKDVNEPEADIDSSKSKEFEVDTNAKLPHMKVNSAQANTCPLNQPKNVDHQPTCFSDSRNFRVHIQRNAIRCDLETPENGLNLLKESAPMLSSEKIHLTQSDGLQSCDKRVHDEMICDLPEGTESLLEIQALEEIVTEVDDDDSTENTDTLKQSEPTCALNLIKNAADDSTYCLESDMGPANLTNNGDVAVTDDDSTDSLEADVVPANLTDKGDVVVTDNDSICSLEADVGPANSTIDGDVAVTDNNNLEMNLHEWVSSYGSVLSSQNDDKIVVGSDEINPVYDHFITDEEIGNVNMRNNVGGLDSDKLEITSTSIARASIIEQICKSASMQTPFQQHQVEGLYRFMTDGILDQMDLGTTVSVDKVSGKHLQTSDTGIAEIDSVFPQYQKFDYATATPFDWPSKNHYSSPVRKLWERSGSSSGSSGICLSSNPDLTCFPIEEDPISNEENENSEEMHDDVENENPVERRENDDEVASEFTVASTKHGNLVSKSSLKYPDRYSSNSVSIEVSVPRTCDKIKHKPKIPHGIKVSRFVENRSSSIATRASTRGNVSANSNNKSSMRIGIPRLSQKDAKRNNIVSNITSFIPIVQQKQAATVCTGKRDIKVKALEAAEAARRREQEKENERKLKKEAMKVERARIGKENAKERELNLKKQEDLKKKEADMAARKRQREEEGRKQLAKKRKLVAETQKIQKLKYEKSHVGKLELAKIVKNAGMAGNMKKDENVRQYINANENMLKKQDTGLRIDKTLANVQHVTSVPESRDASNDCGENDKVTSLHEMSPVKVIPVELTSQENSYDISPYQCSDDEDDDDDDDGLPTKKFVPSWASINRVATVLPLQQKLDPESIFPVDSFCSMDEVLLPRRLQAK